MKNDQDNITALDEVIENLVDKNNNQFNQLEDKRQEIAGLENALAERTESLDVSHHEWQQKVGEVKTLQEVNKAIIIAHRRLEDDLIESQNHVFNANQEAQNHASMVAKIVAAMEDVGYDIAGWANDSDIAELEEGTDAIHDEVKDLRRKLDAIRTQR